MRGTIETPRLVLRAWALGDLEDFYCYAREPQVGQAAGWEPHATRTHTRRALIDNIRAGDGWAVVERHTGRVIGSVKLRPDPKRPGGHCQMVGYSLAMDRWGQGLATEAVRHVLRYAFEEELVSLVSAYCLPGNNRSRRLLEGAGFAYEGLLRSACLLYDGLAHDEWCFSLTMQEYAKQPWRQQF